MRPSRASRRCSGVSSIRALARSFVTLPSSRVRIDKARIRCDPIARFEEQEIPLDDLARRNFDGCTGT